MAYNPNEWKKTPKGVLMSLLEKQKVRCKKKGINPPSYNLQYLYERYLADPDYQRLYLTWVQSGYKKGLKPSIDRIDPTKGYETTNIQMMTWDENRAKGDKEKIRVTSTAVLVYDRQMNLICECESITEAAQRTGVPNGYISDVCRGRHSYTGNYIFKYRGDKFRVKAGSIKAHREKLEAASTTHDDPAELERRAREVGDGPQDADSDA